MTSDPTETENELSDVVPEGEVAAEAAAEASGDEDDAGARAETGRGASAGNDRRHTPEEVEEALAEAGAEDELDRLQGELQELNDRHLRLAAEFTNYRRRADTERIDTWSRAQADLMRRFLEVLDDLQRVSGLDPADAAVSVESIVEGVDLVERKFLRAVQDAGSELVDPAEGDRFDPEIMEAMMRVPTDDPELDDKVSQVFQKGYVFQGHLVRPARVSVFKAD